MDLDSLELTLTADVRREAKRLVALRRDFHRHTELQWEERHAQARILEELADAGIQARPMADTGVVAEIAGQEAGLTLLLRGDMDALPIQEQSGHEWRDAA